MQDIKTICEVIKADSSTMDFEKDGLSFVSLLLDIAEADVMSEKCRQAVETIEKIRIANNDTTRIASMFSRRISSLGMAAYSAKNYAVAEVAFKMIAESGNTTAKNNYAYMIRRHELAVPSNRDHVLALRMLHEGVQEGDAFSLVNTALVFALMLGDDESWLLADSVFKRLSNFGGMLVSSWWEDVAKEGDNEGYLVLFFLLRHGKINNEKFGSIISLAARLTRTIKGFPEWLAKDYITEALDNENWVKSQMFSRNGFERESYLIYVADRQEYLKEILTLCNDHIASIRAKAFAAVMSIIPKCEKKTLLGAIRAVNQLSCVGRIETASRKAIKHCYWTTLGRMLDAETIMGLSFTDRLTVYGWFKEMTMGKRSLIEELLFEERIPRNKKLLFEILLKTAEDSLPLLKEGMKSKYACIRAIAVQGYYDHIQDYWPGVETYVVDRCSKVQDIAIYVMKKHKGVTVASLLMPYIGPDCPISVIRGMLSWKQLCDESCAKKLQDHLKYFKGKRLALAIKTCSAILGATDGTLYLDYLDNASQRVSAEATRALKKVALKDSMIRPIVDSANTIWGRKNAELLLCSYTIESHLRKLDQLKWKPKKEREKNGE